MLGRVDFHVVLSVAAAKTEAKRLLRGLKSGDPDAVQRVRPYFSDPQAATLMSAQLVIARENDYSSWQALRAAMTLRAALSRRFEFVECDVCRPARGEDDPPAYVDFSGSEVDPESREAQFVQIGRCDRYGCLSFGCKACGGVTGVPEWNYGDPIECEGGCGMSARVDEDRRDFGVNVEVISEPSGR